MLHYGQGMADGDDAIDSEGHKRKRRLDLGSPSSPDFVEAANELTKDESIPLYVRTVLAFLLESRREIDSMSRQIKALKDENTVLRKTLDSLRLSSTSVEVSSQDPVSFNSDRRMRHTCQCDRFICRLVSQFGEVSKLLRPVMLNMAMTLTAWIYVYDMKTDERLSAMFLMSGNSTTGNQYHDGIINAFSAMIVLAVVSFSMLLLALWDCRRLVQLWLHMSCLLILFAVSGGFFYDLLKSIHMDEDKIIYEYLPGLVTAYGGFGCI
ncbi:hypothetical protein TELCIR_18198, partial [Teladorsagia circumcincta]